MIMKEKILGEGNILKETLVDVTNDLTEIVKSCTDIEKNFYSLLTIFNGETGKEILAEFKRTVAKNRKVSKKTKNYIKDFHFEENIFSDSLVRLSNAILTINKYLSSIYDVATNIDLEEDFKNACNIMHKELTNLKMLTFILDYIGLGYIDTVTFINNRVSALVLANNITSRILNDFKIVEMKMVMYFHYKNL